jgi:hypothetical protein
MFSSYLNLVIIGFLILRIMSLSFFTQVLNWSLYYFTVKFNDFLFVTCISFDTPGSISASKLMIFPLLMLQINLED